MSNYRTKAINPATGEFEECTMLDDYFGKHKYGVNFDDGDIYKEEEVDFNMPQDNQPKLDPEREKRFRYFLDHCKLDFKNHYQRLKVFNFLAQEIENVAQECYLECLAVECGEGECAKAIRTKFPELITKLEEE